MTKGARYVYPRVGEWALQMDLKEHKGPPHIDSVPYKWI